jgi:hypothetical protein
MTTEPNVKGPASYFPSIEKKYEKPMSYWFALVDAKVRAWNGAWPRERSRCLPPCQEGITWCRFA